MSVVARLVRDNAGAGLPSLRPRIPSDQRWISDRLDIDRDDIFEGSRAETARRLDGLYDGERMHEPNLGPDLRFRSVCAVRNVLAVSSHCPDDDYSYDLADNYPRPTLHREHRNQNRGDEGVERNQRQQLN